MARWRLVSLGICAALAAACGDNLPADPGRMSINGAGGQSAAAGSNSNPAPGGGGAVATPTGAGGGGAPLPAGSTIFARSYGDEGQQTFGGMAADPAGNTYVVGFERPVPIVRLTPTGREFGPIEGTSAGAFVLKYGPSGTLLWRQPFPNAGDSFTNLVAVALQPTTGAVILAGLVSGTLTLEDGTTLTSGTDPQFGFSTQNLVLIALDSAGYLVWSRIYPSPADVLPDSVFVAANGDIEVVGRAANNATVGGPPLCCLNTQFGQNTFVARYSPGGVPIWSAAIAGGDFGLLGAGGAPDGGLVVGGSLTGSVTFDGQTFTGGARDASISLVVSSGMVLRIGPAGHLVWSRIYPVTTASNNRVGAAFDAATNVLLFGQFSGKLDLGGGITLDAPSDSPLKTAGLLAKLDPEGNALWARQFPFDGFNTVEGRAVAADASGNIALAGMTAGGLSLGGPAPLPAATSGDFVAKFTAAGDWIWDRGFAVETSNDASRRIGLGFDGGARLSMAGEFDNTVDFGTGPLTAPGETSTGGSALPHVPDNIFVLKLAP
jgi:hypothetical protein